LREDAQFFHPMIDTAHRLRWHGDLAPGHERRNGMLFAGGVSVEELAATYGTPVLVLDGGVLEASIAEFVTAARPHGIEVAYAGKALLLTALAKVLRDTSLALDVCSLGELTTAERAGWPPERISLHGCGKNADELRAAADGRVGRIIVDNLDELRELAGYARGQSPVNVLLRVNTGIEAHTHAFIQTGGDETKFGIAADDFPAAIEFLRVSPVLRFRGLHSHIGSQIYDAGAFVANVRALMNGAAQFAAAALTVSELIVGGGFGVESGPQTAEAIDIPATIDAIAKGAKESADALGLPLPKIGLEPGRAIIARAGTSIYRVMARKAQNKRTFVIADGGIADNPRPALYDAYHHALLASRISDAPTESAVVCGRSCENDRMTEATLPADLRPGDLLAVCTTGAYTYSMASNYNRFEKPAVVYAKEGKHRLMARRETIEDVLGNDVDA
jgi:diaminopimelate decarboxylase